LLSLKSLPTLTNLTINCRPRDEEHKIRAELPGLEVLNGKEVRKKRKRNDSVSLTQEDLERIAEIYDSIREMYRGADPHSDRELAEEFDSTVKRIMEDLTFKLKQESKKNSAKCILQAKHELVSLCTNKSLAFIAGRTPQLHQILRSCHEIEADLFASAVGGMEA
jgi:hypothetical protein